MSPTPTPTIPTPVPGDNTAIIVGFLDPSMIPAAPGDGCTPQLCDTMGAGALANPPWAGWEMTKVIAEVNASKGQQPSFSLDELLGTSNASATPSIIAGLVISLIVITAAIAALVHHRGTSPASTTAEEAN